MQLAYLQIKFIANPIVVATNIEHIQLYMTIINASYDDDSAIPRPRRAQKRHRMTRREFGAGKS